MQNIVNELPGQQPGIPQQKHIGDRTIRRTMPFQTALLSVIPLLIMGMVTPAGAQAPVVTPPTTKPVPETKPETAGVDDKDDYRVAVGDIFEVAVLLHPELSKKDVTVGPDGRISYPYLGYVLVSGLTLAEFSAKVEKGLSKEIEDPQVTVTLLKRGDRTVSILGSAIRSPGKRIMGGEWRILDLLAESGGLNVERTDFANASLVRKGTVIPIDLAALLIDGDLSQNKKLEPGDTLIVEPRDKTRTHIQVEGEVQKPGWVPVPTDGSLLSVLSAVGGTTAQAGLSHASIKRDGAIIPVDLSKMSTSVETAAFTVKPGDLLFIPLNQKMYAVFGAVQSPKLYPYPEKDSLGLMQAISLAGGITGGADLKNATLVRGVAGTGPNETETKKRQLMEAQAVLAGQFVTASQGLGMFSVGQGVTLALRSGYTQYLVQAKDPERIPINLEDILKRGDLTKNIAIRSGDIIYIPSKEPGRSKFGLQDALGVVPLMRLFVP